MQEIKSLIHIFEHLVNLTPEILELLCFFLNISVNTDFLAFCFFLSNLSFTRLKIQNNIRRIAPRFLQFSLAFFPLSLPLTNDLLRFRSTQNYYLFTYLKIKFYHTEVIFQASFKYYNWNSTSEIPVTIKGTAFILPYSDLSSRKVFCSFLLFSRAHSS